MKYLIALILCAPAYGQSWQQCQPCQQQQYDQCNQCDQQQYEQPQQNFSPQTVFRVEPPPQEQQQQPQPLQPISQPLNPPIAQPSQPLPTPPQPLNPPIEPQQPAPTIDPQALKDQQAAIQKILETQTTIEKSLVIIKESSGCKCDNSKLEAAVASLAKDQRDLIAFLREYASKKPEQQPQPKQTQPIGEKHIVVVADHNDPYWQRLSEDIAKTKESYYGVQVAPTPAFDFGEKPQAVVYENSVPVRVVKGEQGVLDLLSRARRGMSF